MQYLLCTYYTRLTINFILYILTGKRNAKVKYCHVLHVAHKHELHKLTMTRILSQASILFQFVDFVYQAPRLKKCSCSTQLSTKFILLINVKMPTIVPVSWHFNIYLHDKKNSGETESKKILHLSVFSFNEHLKCCAQLC